MSQVLGGMRWWVMGPMTPLTDRQAEILGWIRDQLDSGKPPTFRDIAGHFGFTPNATTSHLKALESKGWIRRSGKSRGIELVERDGLIAIWVSPSTVSLLEQEAERLGMSLEAVIRSSVLLTSPVRLLDPDHSSRACSSSWSP